MRSNSFDDPNTRFALPFVLALAFLLMPLQHSYGQSVVVKVDSSSGYLDISGTGTALNLVDDGEASGFSSVGNAVFPSGDMRVGNNGGVSFGVTAGDFYAGNFSLPAPNLPAGTNLLPFWDDLDSDTGNVYFEATTDTLYIQWHNRPHYSNTGSGTIQLQVYQGANGCPGSPYARFFYQDVDFGNAGYDYGASATVGVQLSLTDYFQYSFNQPVIYNGMVLGVYAADTDGDLVPDTCEACPLDPAKLQPGFCGCGVSDAPGPNGLPSCYDACPTDSAKSLPGICGCGFGDTDTDGDAVPDCFDQCPVDAAKALRGVCACGVADVDANRNGIMDCLVGRELKSLISQANKAVKKLKVSSSRTAYTQVRSLGTKISKLVNRSGAEIQLSDASANLSGLATSARKKLAACAASKSSTLASNRKKALGALKALGTVIQ